jgi:hypothetical protein
MPTSDSGLLMLQHEIERLQREERGAGTRNMAEDAGDPAGTTLVTDTDSGDVESLATSETHHEENERSPDTARDETIEEDFLSPTASITEMAEMESRWRLTRMDSNGVVTRGDRTSQVTEIVHDLGIRDLETQSNSSNVARAVSGDDDDWIPPIATTEIGEPSESTEHQTSSDEGSLHPRPGSHATLYRDGASVSSIGATVGSVVAGEEIAKPAAIEELRAVRRAELMRQMAADIDRYSRQRERGFYAEHGYCRNSPESSPERKRSPIRISAAPSSESSPEQEHSPSTTPAPIHRPRTRMGILGNPDSRFPNISPEWERSPVRRSAAPSPEIRRPPTRQILVIGPPVSRFANSAPQPRQRRGPRAPNRSAGRTEPPEDFLRFLVDLNGNRWPRHDDELRFDEDTTGDASRFTYSLAHSVQIPRPPTLDQTESFRALLTELWNISGQDPFVLRVMAMAERSGMDPREGEELLRRWLEFLTHHSQPRYLNIPGQLRWEDMLFWTALRRGWGRWRPRALMVQEARVLLRRRTEFDHTPLRGEITRAQIVAISLPPLEKERLLQLWDDQIIERRTEGRIERINSNWINFAPRAEQTRLESERGMSLEELRLDRLERLIREETIVNAKRFVSKLVP